MKSLIEKNVGLTFCLALVIGVFFPTSMEGVTDLLIPLMIVLLYISFLKVDMQHVRSEISQPHKIGLQALLNFIAVPVALYAVLKFAGLPHFALAAMLLAAMPAGLGGPVLTTIAGGRVATSVVYSVVMHCAVPLTVPLLFWAFTDTSVAIDSIGMAKKLALLVGVPIAMAWVSRTYFRGVIKKTQSYHKLLSILALAGVAYIVIVPYADTIREDFLSVVPLLIGTYIFYAVLCLSSYWFCAKRSKEEQSALVISRIYMNNALAIVLAFEFFSPEVALITILAEIPWFTTFGAYLWFQEKYIGLKHV